MNINALKQENQALDCIFCYFMETILHIQSHGIEGLPLKNPLQGIFGTFLDASMEIFLDANPPELSRLLLEAEYSAQTSRGAITAEDALALAMIKELSWHIYYDEDCFGYLFSCRNLWGSRAQKYAAAVFYPSLPLTVREKYLPADPAKT